MWNWNIPEKFLEEIDGKEVERIDILSNNMIVNDRFSYDWNPACEIPYGSIYL